MSTPAPPQSPSAFRPRQAFEIIDASIQLLRQHYGQFLTLTGAMYIPVVIIVAILLPQLQRLEQVVTPNEVWGTFGALIPWYVAIIAWTLIMESALARAVADAYVGRRVTPTGSVGIALRAGLRILGGGILKGLLLLLVFVGVGLVSGIVIALAGVGASSSSGGSIIVAGFVGLLAVAATVVAGGYLYAMLFAVPIAVVLEPIGAAQSVSRSMALAKGNVWRIFGVLVLAWLMYLAVAVIFSMFGALLPKPYGSLLSLLAGPFIYPVIPAVKTVLYYDMRIRKEGYDLQLMSQSLDAGAAA